VFALIAALEQGIGFGLSGGQLTADGQTASRSPTSRARAAGVCNIAEALKRSLNTSYYRLMLKLKNGSG